VNGYRSLVGRRWPSRPADAARLEALPECLTIYRGAIQEHAVGRCWTLSRNIAEFFATRFLDINGEPDVSNPRIVMSRKVSKHQVLFYTNERQEQEIVLRAPTDSKQRTILSATQIRKILDRYAAAETGELATTP
jgi:hypothetical protein